MLINDTLVFETGGRVTPLAEKKLVAKFAMSDKHFEDTRDLH